MTMWRWAAALVAAVLTVMVGPASAVTPTSNYETVSYVYGACAQLSSDTVLAGPRGTPERPGAAPGVSPASVQDCGVAAEAGGSVLNFGSRAAAREGLPGDLAAAGNRFFRGATSKSQDFQAVELPGGGYRMQFTSPANNPGYSKVYVQEIDRVGQVLREYKNTMGPDGLIETEWVHGGR